MKRKISVIMAALLILASMAGCQDSGSSADDGSSKTSVAEKSQDSNAESSSESSSENKKSVITEDESGDSKITLTDKVNFVVAPDDDSTKLTEEQMNELVSALDERVKNIKIKDLEVAECKITPDQKNNTISVQAELKEKAYLEDYCYGVMPYKYEDFIRELTARREIFFTDPNGNVFLTGENISSAESKMIDVYGTSTCVVEIQLDDEGTKTLADVTSDNTGESISVWCDETPFSVPMADSEITDGKVIVSDFNNEYSGGFDEETGEYMAKVFASDLLPFALKVESRDDVVQDSGLSEEELSELKDNIPWSYKTEDDIVTGGMWNYYMYNNINSILFQLMEYDTDKKIEDIDLSQKTDGKTASELLYEDTEDSCLRYLTFCSLLKKHNVTIDEEKYNEIAASYYDDEVYGHDIISQRDYTKIGICEYMNYELFMSIYGENGSKEVSKDELKKYYTDTYIHYYDITYSYSDHEDDAEGTKDPKETFKEYCNLINNGDKSIEEIEEQYEADFDAYETPGQPFRINKNDTQYKELAKAAAELEYGKATVLENDDSIELIVHLDAGETAEKILNRHRGDEFDRDVGSQSMEDILMEMKVEEFNAYIADEQSKLSYEKNDEYLKEHDPQKALDTWFKNS